MLTQELAVNNNLLSVVAIVKNCGVSKETAQIMREQLVLNGIAKKDVQSKLTPNGYWERQSQVDFADSFVIDTVDRRDKLSLNVVHKQCERIRKYCDKQAEYRASLVQYSQEEVDYGPLNDFMNWLKNCNGIALTRHVAEFFNMRVDEVIDLLEGYKLFDGVLSLGDTPDKSEDWGQITLLV